MRRPRKTLPAPEPERGRRPPNWQDRTGQRFGRLVITGWAGYALLHGKRRNFWRCLCDCGASLVAAAVAGRSCGCLQREAQREGPRSMARKTALLIEQACGRRISLKQAAKLFHVKHKTLAARMQRYPENPAKWGLTRRRPPKITRRER